MATEESVPTTIWDLKALVELIRFKQVVLNLDLATRNVLLEKCLDIIDLEDETLSNLRKWFTDCIILSERDNTQEGDRKQEIRAPSFWERLYAMAHIPILRQIATFVYEIPLTPPYPTKNNK